jgi:hypothetical protein
MPIRMAIPSKAPRKALAYPAPGLPYNFASNQVSNGGVGFGGLQANLN